MRNKLLLCPLLMVLFFVSMPSNAEVLEWTISKQLVFNYSFSIATDPFVDGESASGLTDPPSFFVSMPAQSAFIQVPTFDPSLGTLKSMRFMGDIVIENFSIHGRVIAPPGLNPDLLMGDETLFMRGVAAISGKMNIFADGAPVAWAETPSFIYNAYGCKGALSCTFASDFSDMLVVGSIVGGDFDPETENFLLEFSEASISGWLNAQNFAPGTAEYGGSWQFTTNVNGEYHYTPVSQVPLPAGIWLFFSALSSLGVVSFFRRTSRSRR